MNRMFTPSCSPPRYASTDGRATLVLSDSRPPQHNMNGGERRSKSAEVRCFIKGVQQRRQKRASHDEGLRRHCAAGTQRC